MLSLQKRKTITQINKKMLVGDLSQVLTPKKGNSQNWIDKEEISDNSIVLFSY